MQKFFLGVSVMGVAALGLFFAFSPNNVVPITDTTQAEMGSTTSTKEATQPIYQPPKPLENPPDQIRAIYLTSWSGGSAKKITQVIDMTKNTSINAVVVDIKDYSGYVAYDANVKELDTYKAKEIRIKDIDALIRKLHENNIYVIARITALQDPLFAQARPDLSVQDASKTTAQNPIPWQDRKKLSWMDPSSHEVWNYIGAIARDAALHGFDELNFDYIRFPSDGALSNMYFPHWDKTIPRHEIIAQFFAYLREQLPTTRLSADLFGLSTVAADDMGIGQVIQDAYTYFDFVCPMVYPSHYADGSFGYNKPALYPYEIVKHSLDVALTRLYPPQVEPTNASSSSSTPTPPITPAPKFRAQLRPWLQDFDLGADYGPDKVEAQIQATRDALGSDYVGYLLWNPSNVYIQEGIID